MQSTDVQARPRLPEGGGAAQFHDPLCQWIIAQGLAGATVAELMQGFCDRAAGAGLPLLRCFIGVNTLNPLYRGYSLIWRRAGSGLSEESFLRREGDRAEFLRSPFHYMSENGLTYLRQRLNEPAEHDFQIYDDFRAEGATDYVVNVIAFAMDGVESSESGMLFSATTDRPGGFSTGQIELLREQLQILGLAVRAAATHKTALDVLAAYLGKDAGHRVLHGDIDRGNLHSIRAVILFADLRGFTRMSESVDAGELGSLLDTYMEAMVKPVEIYGGEVLKFMGDGILAVFEIGADEAKDSCRSGTGAASEMLAGITLLNKRRRESDLPTMDLDIAVHLGDVLYGNVGAPGRLDFTVIGPAVNEASRIELKCRDLDVNVLFSDDFYNSATYCRPALRTLGRHQLRDLDGPRELFTLTPDMLA